MRIRTVLSFWLFASFLSPTIAAHREHWLSRGPGVPAAAMGGAYTGNAADVSAIYYNSASLRYQGGAVMAEHVPVYGGGRYNFIGAHYPLRWGSLGLGVAQMAFGGIEGRLSATDAPTELDSTQSAFFFPFAGSVGDYVLGSNVTMLRYDLGGYKDSGFGLDAAVARRFVLPMPKTSLQVGFTIHNLIEPSIRLANESERLPRSFVLGLSMSRNLFSSYRNNLDSKVWDRLTGNVDIIQDEGGSAVVLGAEYLWRAGVRLRAGLSDEVSFGMGYGPALGSFEVNYAFLFTETLPTHRMSFSYKFSDPIGAEPLRVATEVDYTDPMIELESQFRSLGDHYRARVNNLVQGIGGRLQMGDVLRWLVADPENKDAWSLYRSIGGQQSLKVKEPRNTRVRKEYLNFAVAYCNRTAGAGVYGSRFIEKYGRSDVGRFVKMVLEQKMNTERGKRK